MALARTLLGIIMSITLVLAAQGKPVATPQAAGSDVVTARGGLLRTGVLDVPAPDFDGPMSRRWTTPLGDRITTAPVASDGIIVVATAGRTLTAIDGPTGSVLWRHPRAADVRWSPSIAGETVYATDAKGSVVALNLHDGTTIWETVVPVGEVTSPAIAGGLVVVTSSSKVVTALDQDTGEVEWQQSFPEIISTMPSLDDGSVVFGDVRGTVYVLDLFTGETQLTAVAASGISDAVVLTGDALIVASGGGIISFSRDTGKELWHTSLGLRPTGAPLVHEDLVIVATEGRSIRGLDRTNGNEVWREPTSDVVRELSGVGGYILMGSDDGRIAAIDAQTGSVVWQEVAPAAIVAEPVVVDGMLIVVTAAGDVVAWGQGPSAGIWIAVDL